MRKEPSARLGAKGAWQVRSHPWFASLSWDDVLSKKIAAPFKPYIHDELDVGNFAEEFTGQDPIDSPAQAPQKYNDLFRVSQSPLVLKLFNFFFSFSLKGYSFIGPPILFSQNSVTPALSDTPLSTSPFLQQYSLADRQLGMGSFSICHVCVERSTGQEYAVKIVSRRHNPTREVTILQQCQGHPNIVQLHEVIQDPVMSSRPFII